VVGVRVDDVLEVDGQGGAVGGVGAAGGADALGDVEDDAGEAVFVEVDLLVVGDLADGAADRWLWLALGECGMGTHLTSAKEEGSSAIRAPPKRGVLRYEVIAVVTPG
jgi:hypothetical protein